MLAPCFYTDKVSAKPGETVCIFASTEQSPCTLVISRVGRDVTEVARYVDIVIDNHPTPNNADTDGCGWPSAFEFEVGDNWRTGYYDLSLTSPDGASTQHYICVRKSADAKKAKTVLILNTNTYAAYNYWGGANAYANVENLMAGKLDGDASRDGSIAKLSRMRPYAQMLLCQPEITPRLVNGEIRGVDEMVAPGDPAVLKALNLTPYDRSAGFVNNWEHHFAAWAETNAYDIDYLTDHDFEFEEDLLNDYNTVLLVGHSEYWSGNARRQVDHFTEEGGNLTVFSGNTCYWKVRWEDDGETMVVHKCRGEENDPLWANSETRTEATHLWSHEAFAAPEAQMTGLSFLYGGYHRLCMCVARGGGAYTVYNDEHWALKGTDLYYGDMIGGELPLIGYENDGCIINFDNNGLPIGSGVGVPTNLEIIAIAPATLAESERSPFPAMIPREETAILSKLAYGKSDEQTIERLMRGHAVMASFKRGNGEVFNAGTTEWAFGLLGLDPFVEKITHNVFERFGV